MGAREISYFLLCLVGLHVVPHYLLTNVAAWWWLPEGQEGPGLGKRMASLCMFALSPEKFLVMSTGNFFCSKWSDILSVPPAILTLMDMAAVSKGAAAGVATSDPPAPNITDNGLDSGCRSGRARPACRELRVHGTVNSVAGGARRGKGLCRTALVVRLCARFSSGRFDRPIHFHGPQPCVCFR